MDEHIINGCIQNKREAQYELYKKYYEQFMRVCLRYTKSRDEAGEILNTAFLKIFSKINTYASTGDFVGWMHRIVINTALDYLKSNKKHNEHSDLELAKDQFSETGESLLQAKDLLKMVQSLPNTQSQVFNLFAMEGYSHLEVSKLLKISEASSKWHLFNARKTLQNMVNQLHNDN